MENAQNDLFVSGGMARLLILLIVLFSIPITAQKPVKIYLIPYFEQVLVPPKLCKNAFDKGICKTDNATAQCDAKILFRELKTKLDSILKEINSVPAYTAPNEQSKLSDEIKK